MPDPQPPEQRKPAPMMVRAAETRPASYQEADNSIEIVWTTGAAGMRFDWYDGEFYVEELSLDPGAVRLDRLVEEGNQTEAQRELLDALKKAFDGAADHAEGLAAGWHNIANEASGAWEWMGKALDRVGPFLLSAANGGTMSADLFAGRLGQGGNGAGAAANAARARAQALADQYSGASQLDGVRRTVGTLQAGLSAGGTPDQVRQWTSALEANQHALSTWIPAQQKATQIAQLDARIAAAKDAGRQGGAGVAARATRNSWAGHYFGGRARARSRQGRRRGSTRHTH